MVRKQGNIAVRGDYEDFMRRAERELVRIGLDLEETAVRFVEKKNISVDGDIQKSIKSIVKDVLGKLRLQFGASARHAIFVHEGTKPHWPPFAPIRSWVRKKLNVPVEKADSVAFLVQRKIAREGTPAKPFLAVAIRAHINTIAGRIAKQVAT